jgi:hypothetical protein
MKNTFILLLIIPFLIVPSVSAQENDGAIGPRKGNKIISLLTGKDQTFGNWLALPDANQISYEIQVPLMGTSISENSAINMLGIEAKYFLTDKWALRLSGTGNISVAKGYEGVPGVSDANGVSTLVPFYSQVPSLSNHEVIAGIGLDRYFSTKNKHVFWYLAPVINFHYNRLTGENSTDYLPITEAPYFRIVDPGTIRYAEGLGAGLSGNIGIDYFTSSGIVFGFEVQGANYTYIRNTQLPMQGLSTLKSDSHNIAFLAYPTLRIGFKF